MHKFKTFRFLVLLFFLTLFLRAQDLITLKSGEKIQCIVTHDDDDEKDDVRFVSYKIRGEEVKVIGREGVYKYTNYTKKRNEIARIEKNAEYAFIRDTVINDLYKNEFHDLLILINNDSIICNFKTSDDNFQYVTLIRDGASKKIPLGSIQSYKRDWRKIVKEKKDTVIIKRKGPEFKYRDIVDIPAFSRQIVRLGGSVGPGFFSIDKRSMIGVQVSGDISLFLIPQLGLGVAGAYFFSSKSNDGFESTTNFYSYEFFIMPRTTINEKNTINLFAYIGIGSQNYNNEVTYSSQYSSGGYRENASYITGSVGGGIEFLVAKMLALTVESKITYINSSFISIGAGLRIYIER